MGKVRDCPRIGIPCYVIVDPRLGTGVVLSEIGPGEPFSFGDTIGVGEWAMDTSRLPLC